MISPHPPSAPVPSETAEAPRLLLELAAALHAAGTPAHRLEGALAAMARRLGVEAAFFSTPTSLMVGIGALTEQRVHLLRVEPGEPNLALVAGLGDIMQAVIDGRCAPAEARLRLRRLQAEPPPYPAWLGQLAFVLSSAAVACFLGVRQVDVAIAALLGLVTGLVAWRAGLHEATRPMVVPLAAFLVSTIALALDGALHGTAGFSTTVAGLVVLLPGLTFTVGLTELSTRHLSSGTARLSGALVTFLGLGFGVALGARLGSTMAQWLVPLAGRLPEAMVVATLPGWSTAVALVVAPLAFTVLLRAAPRDALPILVTCAAAYLTAQEVGEALGEEFGAFAGAALVSGGSVLLARWRRGVAMVTQVPGLLILVPGSIGFRSVTSLLGQQVEAGIATAFQLALVGISLAAGVVAGNAVTFVGRRRER